MAIGKTNTGGGGSNKAFAFIVVTYDEEAETLTCVNATTGKAVKKKGDENPYCFVVPEAGTYRVTITKTGEEDKYQDVPINAKGQRESISIVFWDGTIYDSGNEYTEQTGGWTGTGTKNSGNLYIAFSGKTSAYLRTVNKIDLSAFTTLKATVIAQTHYSSWQGNERVNMGVSSSDTVGSLIGAVKDTGSSVPFDLSLTLTDAMKSEPLYVAFYAAGGDHSDASITVEKVWLE